MKEVAFVVSDEIKLTSNGTSVPTYSFNGYLFRTDNAQKWTTDKTEKCILFMPEKDHEVFGNFEHRKSLSSKMFYYMQGISNKFNKAHISSDRFYSHLRTFVTYLKDAQGHDVFNMDDEILDRVQKKVCEYFFSLRGYNNITPLFSVLHCDDNKCVHLHTMYYISPNSKKKPGIGEMLGLDKQMTFYAK